jgi:hypothetical protein
VYDLRDKNKFAAGLSLGMTIFVCVILSTGALMFSNLAIELVIHPIETMMEKVNKIAADPLGAAQNEEDEVLEKD